MPPSNPLFFLILHSWSVKGCYYMPFKRILLIVKLGAYVMPTMLYLSFILWGWIIFEAYLQWINYKGRFRYRLLEGTKLWRWLQSKVGLLSLPISFMFTFGLIVFLSLLIEFIFNISNEVAVASVVSFFLGVTLTNAMFDKNSVEAFEKYCLRCPHKRECNDFLDKNCMMKYIKHRIKMAVLLEEKASTFKKK